MPTLRALALAAALAGVVSLAGAAPSAPALPTTAPGSKAILLGVESVRRDLRLNSLQRAVLEDIRDGYREEARAIVAKAGSGAETKAQAQRRLDALTATYDRRALRALNDEQRARLGEIERQVLGAYSLLAGDVQRKLGLTPEQKERLAQVWAKSQKTVSAINRRYEAGKISHYQRLTELRKNRLSRQDALLGALTAGQRTQLTALQGKKIAI